MRRYVTLALFIVTFGLQLAVSQTQSVNGSIRGRVTDAAGSSVPQAKVAILNGATGFTRSAETGEEGYYVFPNLPLGTYTVTIQKEGFDTQRHPGVVLDAGTEGVIDAQLKVGSVNTTVEVSGGAPASGAFAREHRAHDRTRRSG